MKNTRLEELRQMAGAVDGAKSAWMDELILEVDRLTLQNGAMRDVLKRIEKTQCCDDLGDHANGEEKCPCIMAGEALTADMAIKMTATQKRVAGSPIPNSGQHSMVGLCWCNMFHDR